MNNKIRHRHQVPVIRPGRRISLAFEVAIGMLVLAYAGYNVWMLDQSKAQVKASGPAHTS